MTLEQELQKTQYIGMDHQEKLAALQAISEPVIGHIRYGDTLHLVSMLARGLRARIESCQIAELKAAFVEALHPSYLASPAYSINVGLPEIKGMLDMGLTAGVVTAAEHAFIIQLATYDRKPWESVTLRDVVAHFEPTLIDGQWHELPKTVARNFVIRLLTAPLESTYLVIQMQDQYADGVSDWYHATALHGLSAAREYVAALPFNGYQRKIRWKCDYTLDAVVSVR